MPSYHAVYIRFKSGMNPVIVPVYIAFSYAAAQAFIDGRGYPVSYIVYVRPYEPRRPPEAEGQVGMWSEE